MSACEIAAKRPGHKAFVGVYPPLPEKNVPRWFVRKFEIPIELLDEYFGEEDLLDSHLKYLDTIAEVEALLVDWGVDPARLDAPWHSDYPL